MLAGIFIITSWAKASDGLVRQHNNCGCNIPFPVFCTPKVISLVLKLIVFVSWCIYPMALLFGKEYKTFNNFFHPTFLACGGTFTLFYGITLARWLNRVSGDEGTRNTTQEKQLELAIIMAYYLVGIGIYVLVLFVYLAVNSFLKPASWASKYFIDTLVYTHLHLFLVYCLLRIFEGKIKSNLFRFKCFCCHQVSEDAELVSSGNEEHSKALTRTRSLKYLLEMK
jgi:hypothetical protein